MESPWHHQDVLYFLFKKCWHQRKSSWYEIKYFYKFFQNFLIKGQNHFYLYFLPRYSNLKMVHFWENLVKFDFKRLTSAKIIRIYKNPKLIKRICGIQSKENSFLSEFSNSFGDIETLSKSHHIKIKEIFTPVSLLSE